jgi:hypothetical protein
LQRSTTSPAGNPKFRPLPNQGNHQALARTRASGRHYVGKLTKPTF